MGVELLAEEAAFTTGYWGAVGFAAAIATALATAASTATAIWWRYQDRTEAEWSIRVELRGGYDSDGRRVALPRVEVVLQNIGDGTAHQVCLDGRLLTKPLIARGELEISNLGNRFREEFHQPIPVMRTGDEMSVAIETESFDVWDSATLEVTWWPPPTRKKKDWFVRSRQQRQVFKLGEVTPPPTDVGTAKG